MKDKILFSMLSGVIVLGGIILHKVNDVQKEIEHFEEAKGIVFNRKEYEKKIKEGWK